MDDWGLIQEQADRNQGRKRAGVAGRGFADDSVWGASAPVPLGSAPRRQIDP